MVTNGRSLICLVVGTLPQELLQLRIINSVVVAGSGTHGGGGGGW